MVNISTELKEEILTVTIDLSQEHGRSKTGKTVIIASTQGNVEVATGIKMGINVYKYPGVL